MKILTTDELQIIAWRVVDSDTLHAWIEVAPHVALQERIRIVGIEGGELETTNGQIAAAVLNQLLHVQERGSLRFVGSRKKRDNHGRIVADIRLANGALLSEVLLNTGSWSRRTALSEPAVTQAEAYG